MTALWLRGAADGDVLITDGRVAAVGGAVPAALNRLGQTAAAARGAAAAHTAHTGDARVEVLDCSGAQVAPGRVCAHTHLYSGLAPLGMPAPAPPPESFVQILERVWWRLDRALDADSLVAGARLAIAEALLDGTTCLIDHHESPSLIEGSLSLLADAFEDLGARGLVCYGATERNGGLAEGRAGLAECARFLAGPTRPTVRGAVALHASFTVSDALIREAGALCAEHGAVMHVHVAEDAADVADAQRRGYAGPLERLQALGAVPAGSLLVHGVHVSPAQARAAARAGAWWVQNPRSNAGNRVGYPHALAAAEGRVALGTDGYPARMADELAALRAHGEAKGLGPGRLAAGRALAGDLFDDTFNGATLGAVADFAVRTPDGWARHVCVGGRVVVRDGALVHADLARLRATAQVEAQRLWSRMEP